MASIFSKIVAGEIPCYKVCENEDFFAFLDINPNAKGHTLCIPKKEVNRIFELDEKTYLNLLSFARKVALAIEKTFVCDRVGMIVIGLEVPHVHIHLIPLNEMEDATFKKKVNFSKTEMTTIAAQIKNNL